MTPETAEAIRAQREADRQYQPRRWWRKSTVKRWQETAAIAQAEERAKLRPQPDPRWKRIDEGKHLGYRKMVENGPGKWLARAWSYSERKYKYKKLGSFANLPEEKRYDAALAAASAWFQRLRANMTMTVLQACEQYLDERRAEGGKRAEHVDADERCLRRVVYSDPISHVELALLTQRDCAEWKRRVLAAGKSKASFNRDAVPLIAALNLAYQRGQAPSDYPWKSELRKFKESSHCPDFTEKLEADLLLVQDGACGACFRPFSDSLKYCKDHNHDTDEPRGLLCSACNLLEGIVRDAACPPERISQSLAAYLADPPARAARLL